MLRGLATVNFWAADLEAAKGWYTDLLGVAPYFERPGYAEFRIGDYQDELGLIDSRYAPARTEAGPGGAIMYWHVDDVPSAVETLLAKGARELEGVTARGGASSPLPRSTRSATSSASCSTRITWRSWRQPGRRDRGPM